MQLNVSDVYNEITNGSRIEEGSIDYIISTIEKEAPNMVIFAVVLAVWSYIINVLIIFLILSNNETRKKLAFLQIINMSSTHLLTSIVVMPLTIYYEINPWMLGQTVCKLYIMIDVILPYVFVLILLFIDILYFIENLNFKISNFQQSNFVKFVTLSTPWFLGITVVVIIWTLGEKPIQDYPGICLLMLNFNSSIASPVATYFFPSFWCIILSTLLCICKIKRHCDSDENHSNRNRDAIIQSTHGADESQGTNSFFSVILLCIVNVLWILMWFPYKFVSFKVQFCEGEECLPSNQISIKLVVAFVWLGASSSGLIPIMWLFDPRIRIILRGHFDACFKSTNNNDYIDIIDLEELPETI